MYIYIYTISIQYIYIYIYIYMPLRYSNLFNCLDFLSLFPCVIVYFNFIASF